MCQAEFTFGISSRPRLVLLVVAPRILVVAETLSLGRAVSELLEARDIAHDLVGDVTVASPLWSVAERYRLLVVACNAPYCATGRRFLRGELPGATLLVLGSRDPALQGVSGVQIVPLPIRPDTFLPEIEGLLGRPSRPAGEPRPGEPIDEAARSASRRGLAIPTGPDRIGAGRASGPARSG